MNIRRVSLMAILGTMMVGQVVMLREMGVVAEVIGLYQIAVLCLFTYGFWPQIEYGLFRGIEFAVNRFSTSENEGA
jgi:hypothetical protein